MNTQETIGLIGVGTMGRRMLKTLTEAGHTVTASDPVPAAQDFIREMGAGLADSPAEVARHAEIILLSLPAPKQIAQVIDGEGGITEAAGAGHVVVDTSTVDPGTNRAMASVLGERGAVYLDAPILGRPSVVGKWVMPVGGDGAVLERVQPVLSAFARKTVHVGGSGSGSTLKLLNQLMFSAINGITAEVFALAEKTGLSQKVFYETVADSGAATVSGLFKECGRKVVDDDYDPVFSIDLLCKDSGLGVQMARDLGATPVIASCVQVLNEIASGNGYGSLDTSAMVKVFQGLFEKKRTEN
jgi:3-hydroxyisobutyrate dehydrogenase-like beta-hydroxyacid dehydrogenase